MAGASGRRVLLAWEMGAGLGHVRRLLTVAEALRGAGWEPWLALRDIQVLPERLAAVAAGVLQAPVLVSQAPPRTTFAAQTYADIMAVSGYLSETALAATLAGWDGLLELLAPRLVVADYAPVLPLAALGRVPVIAFGDGFCVPPPDRFPRLREGGEPFADPGQVLENARRVQRRRARPEPASLPALMAGAGQHVCVVPEVDVYRAERPSPAAGALEGLPERLPPAEGPASLFFYLPGHYGYTPRVLEAIAASGMPAEGYLYPEPPGLRARFEPRGIRLHDRPVPLAEALARATALVHHGGIGTTEQALALGRPQLLVPATLEQSLNARSVVALGVGLAVPNRERTAEGFARALARLTGSAPLRQAAARVAAGVNRPASLPALLALCERVAAEPPAGDAGRVRPA
jgi:hypothetical protein